MLIMPPSRLAHLPAHDHARNPGTLHVLLEADPGDLDIRFTDAAGAVSNRAITPASLHQLKTGEVSLFSLCHKRGDWRTFSLDRISRARHAGTSRKADLNTLLRGDLERLASIRQAWLDHDAVSPVSTPGADSERLARLVLEVQGPLPDKPARFALSVPAAGTPSLDGGWEWHDVHRTSNHQKLQALVAAERLKALAQDMLTRSPGGFTLVFAVDRHGGVLVRGRHHAAAAAAASPTPERARLAGSSRP